ncbi:pyridoxal phosphate-dependent aminotransferase [Microlunatus flavus]|uniref:Aminotransferase n=1 Tax=Microlunatus flavus TaxID=1036181 RepID=A0A1H9H0K0_9ACTN|nr:pyridoxal phosphate-dependent aminotransferase [Microlunatus flavus]SEQ55773.1 aspartate aminotransferase/aminotransferase [Microlunatus flavus]
MTAGAFTVGSSAAAAIAPSGIRAVADLAWRTPGTLQLQMGEPSHPTPPHVVDALAQAAREGNTRYGPTPGVPAFREAVAAKVVRVNGLDVSPDDVTVCAGGVEGLGATYRALLDAGDEILVPDPGWPNLGTLAVVCGAVPVGYPLLAGDHPGPDLDALDRLVTPRTQALVVNTPSNPTGGGFSEETLAAVLGWAARHGLWVVADECYDEMWLDEPQPCAALVAQRLREAEQPAPEVVSVFSLSKTHAMTGFRLGYVVTPPALTPVVRRVQETTLSCVSTPTQWAGAAALGGPQDHVEEMRAAYRSRRDRCVEQLRDQSVLTLATRPAGAFYLWLSYAGPEPSTDLARHLVTEHQVALAPGRAFGPAGEGHLRISLASADDVLTEGLRRVVAALGDRARVGES